MHCKNLIFKAALLLAGLGRVHSEAEAQTVQSWTVPLQVQIDNNPFNLYFGVYPNATAGFDADIDTIAPPPPFTPYAVLSIPVFPNTLQADYRGAADSISWSLRIVNTNGATSKISWNTSKVRPIGNGKLVMNDTLNMFAKSSTSFAGDQTVRIKCVGIKVSVKSAPANSSPESYALESYPNPFSSTTAIALSLPTARPVDVRIFNLLGQEIRAFAPTSISPGRLIITWDGRDARGIPIPSGIYFCRLEARGVLVWRKLYRVQ